MKLDFFLEEEKMHDAEYLLKWIRRYISQLTNESEDCDWETLVETLDRAKTITGDLNSWRPYVAYADFGSGDETPMKLVFAVAKEDASVKLYTADDYKAFAFDGAVYVCINGVYSSWSGPSWEKGKIVVPRERLILNF